MQGRRWPCAFELTELESSQDRGSYKGKELEALQSSGTHVIVLENKHSNADLESARKSCEGTPSAEAAKAKPDPMGIRPGSSTQSCPGTNPNDPCNIR